MDLFRALPALRRHPLLSGKAIRVVGISTIIDDGTGHYFEISEPRYWTSREDGTTTVGIGAIRGTARRGETVEACLRRRVSDALGARVRFESPQQTYLVRDWRIVDALDLPPSKKRAAPLMVILTPPRLGGPDTPDHLALVSYRTRLRGAPAPQGLLGLLRVQNEALSAFFGRDEWPLSGAETYPGLTINLNQPLPDGAILRPTLAGRAFQLLVRAGLV
jgi:hypothetical protein